MKLKSVRVKVENRRTPMLGIIGGIGSETSCNLCLSINNKIRKATQVQPDITLINLPVPLEVEEKTIIGKDVPEMLVLLENAVKRFNKLNPDLIVIPCNSVHIFLDRLRIISRNPILSIIEECAKKCSSLNLKKVGILSSETTIKEGLYKKELSKFKIELISPSKTEQRIINKAILNILNDKIKIGDKKRMLKIIQNLKKRGSEVIILGCTDIQLLLSSNNLEIPIIDSLAVLEEQVINKITKFQDENIK